MVECFKVLIDSFGDFGQFVDNSETTEMSYDKPFSPYAKIFDQCSMSTQQSFTLQTVEPLTLIPALGSSVSSYTYFLVGYSDFSASDGTNTVDACWPGRLDWLAYKVEKMITSYATFPRYQATISGGTPDEPMFHTDLSKEPNFNEEERGFISKYVGPYLSNALINLIEHLRTQMHEFE
jgi:hypothetical protein